MKSTAIKFMEVVDGVAKGVLVLPVAAITSVGWDRASDGTVRHAVTYQAGSVVNTMPITEQQYDEVLDLCFDVMKLTCPEPAAKADDDGPAAE